MSDETFGDTEPEDAWDATDPTIVLIDNLFRRLFLLEHRDMDRAPLFDSLLFDIENRLRPIQARREDQALSDRDMLRLAQLEEDLAFVRERDERGHQVSH